jgi:transmembrane sensor
MSTPDWVARPLGEGRIARHWDGVRHRLRRRRSRRASLVAVGALLGGVLLGALVMHRWVAGPEEAVTWSDLHIETGAQRVAMRLSDGSAVRLGADTRLQACDGGQSGACIRVDRGRAHFEVTPRGSSALRVLAGEVEVMVVGTRFVVDRTVADGHHEVSVAVEEGAVRVMRPGSPGLELEAGQTWSTRLSGDGPPATAEGRRTADGQPAPVGTLHGSGVEGAQTGGVGAEPPVDEGVDTNDATGPAAAAAGTTEGPRALWERALQARDRGEHRAEERAYVMLLRRHPDDARARQAAFELGRLRMDAFGDPAGAIGPLRRTAQMGVDTVFHEDALARLVRAYAQTGDAEACQVARHRYLERYPSGMHARFVRTLCTGP